VSTIAGHQPPLSHSPEQDAWPGRKHPAVLRLTRLHLASRRVPTAVAALAALAAVLQIALRENWIHGTGNAALQLPLVLETAAATVISATTASPFGESERTGVRWLPWLRLGTAVALTAAAMAAFAVGGAGSQMPGGELDAARNVAGLAGIALLCAAAFGGNLSWVGPLAYFMISEYALTTGWTTPWTWPARPPHDLGAGLCAGLVFTAGAVTIAVCGDRTRE
jgi:hypothetical protein